MAQPPLNPKIYHITHLRNLPQIAGAGFLWSDKKRIELDLDCDVVGMAHIKRRRLEAIPVTCHPGTFVGHYVPFYFCPRSIMLYILHQGNHPDVTYTEGQQPIVHLEADLRRVVAWAEERGRPWAFSLQNAGARYAAFRSGWDGLRELNWAAIRATRWSRPETKEGKQAEFLLHEAFPWTLVEKIGVCNREALDRATGALAAADHRPPVAMERGWYYEGGR